MLSQNEDDRNVVDMNLVLVVYVIPFRPRLPCVKSASVSPAQT